MPTDVVMPMPTVVSVIELPLVEVDLNFVVPVDLDGD